MNGRNVLLVEGEADRGFFEAFCESLSIPVDQITPATPDAFPRIHPPASNRNTKRGVIDLLPLMISQLYDGSLLRLGVVVDADASQHGQGFSCTIEQVSNVVTPHGYSLGQSPEPGLVYCHNNGLADLGLWVMPNNADDGMLEDWLKPVLRPDEAPLLGHANHAIDTLPDSPRFKPLHRSKAEIATWLAWQQKPGHGLYRAVEDQLLNPQAEAYQSLVAWLRRVFP